MCTAAINYYTTPEDEQTYKDFKSFKSCPPHNIDLYYVLKTSDGKWSRPGKIVGRIQEESNELHLPDIYVEDDMTFYLGRSNYIVSLGKLRNWKHIDHQEGSTFSKHITSIDETFNNRPKIKFSN